MTRYEQEIGVTRRHFFQDCRLGVGKVALASLLANSPRPTAMAAPAAGANPLAPRPPQHTPKARVSGKDDIEHATDSDRLPSRHAEENVGNLHCRQGDHPHDEAIKEQTKVDGTETPHN